MDIQFSLYCKEGPLSDDDLKGRLLHQCHKAYDVFADAMRADAYEILTATVPYRLTYAGNPWEPGSVRISYGIGKDGWFCNTDVVPASEYDSRLYANVNEGELRSTFHLPGVGVSVILIFPTPARIRTLIQGMLDRGEKRWEDPVAIAKERAEWEFDAQMQAEAAADPEGAFGGRGNNFDWRR